MLAKDDREQNITVASPEMVAEAKFLLSLSPEEGIGLVASYLLQTMNDNPAMVRKVFKEPIIRNGFTGESMLQQLQRVCR
jgi:hypothetical protein